jgi:hypothetical protein
MWIFFDWDRNKFKMAHHHFAAERRGNTNGKEILFTLSFSLEHWKKWCEDGDGINRGVANGVLNQHAIGGAQMFVLFLPVAKRNTVDGWFSLLLIRIQASCCHSCNSCRLFWCSLTRLKQQRSNWCVVHPSTHTLRTQPRVVSSSYIEHLQNYTFWKVSSSSHI